MKSDLRNVSRAAALVVAGLLAAASARAQDVVVDFDKAADFSHYKTFALKLGTSWGNQLSEKRVMDEITSGLQEKGWKVAPEGSADAIVVLHGATQMKKSLNTFYSGGYGGYRWGGWGGMGDSTTTVSEYKVGTLVTDIFDAKSKNLIWRGTASDEISDKPEKNVKELAKASDKLFKNFPPGSAEKKK
jgi:Domain of unknown function (DUF4136)